MDTATASSAPAKRHWRPKLPEQLPGLKDKWLTLYMIIWVIMLPLAIIGPARYAYAFYGYQSKPAWVPYGIQLLPGSDELRVTAALTAEARRSGLNPGDLIVAIDEWRVPQSPTALTDARVHLVKAEGASTTFKVIGKDERVRDVRLTYSQRHIDEVFHGTGLSLTSAVAITLGGILLSCLGFVAAAVLLFVRQRRQAVPALLSLGFLISSSFALGAQWSDLGVSNSVVDFVGVIGFCLLIVALFALPDGRLRTPWVRLAVLTLPLLLLASAVQTSSTVFLAAIGACCVLVMTALIGRYRSMPIGPAQQQMRWVFFGFVGGMVLVILDIIGLLLAEWLQPVDYRWYAWGSVAPFLGDVGVLFIAAGLMISMLKYRLYDAEAVIGRSAAYGLLTLGFVALFAGSGKLVELIGERYFEHQIGIAAGAIGAAVAAVCIVPLHDRIHRWAERRFQKPLIRLREGLPEAVADLRESASIEQLVLAVMSRIEAGVRSTREALLLRETDKLAIAGARRVSVQEVCAWQSDWRPGEHMLDCDRRDTVFPLRMRLNLDTGDEPETIGWILLGPRPDGSFFGKDERETLEQIAGPVARAIHIARLREEREHRQQEQNAQTEARLGAIEQVLDSIVHQVGRGPTEGTQASS